MKQYDVYSSLVSDLKFISSNPIDVDGKISGRPHKRVANRPVDHTSINEENILTIESILDNSDKFKFKLKCYELFDKHYFRFDSFGPAHKNRNPKRPYESVKTPHFNKFDEDGYNIAYRTEESIKSVSFGIQKAFESFCREANVSYSGETAPEIKVGDHTEINFPKTNFFRITSINFVK